MKKTIWITAGVIFIASIIGLLGNCSKSSSTSRSTVPALTEQNIPEICGTYQRNGLFTDDGRNRTLEVKTNGKFSLKIGESPFAGAEPAYVDQLGLRTKSPNTKPVEGKWELERDTITFSDGNGFSLKGKILKKKVIDNRWRIIDENGNEWKGRIIN